MALSGPQALKSLDDAVREIRREENDISQRMARSGELTAKLQETEAALFRQLAELRLINGVNQPIRDRLSAAEAQAHEMIAKHGEDLKAANETTARLDTEIAGFARTRHDLLAEIDSAQAELKKLAEKIAKVVSGDPDYAAKQRRANELAEIAKQSLTKTEQAESDREHKGRPYREDPLFMYLWEAGYGTRNYRANNLIRFFDGMVARLVRYDDARPNFAMLNDLPMRLREHAERQLAAAQAAEQEVDALEQDAVDQAGGKPMRETIAKAQAQLEKLDADMAEKEDARDEAALQLRHLAEGRDPAFNEATKLLAHNLGQQDLRQLENDARHTPTPKDDQILDKISELRARLSEENAEAADMKARLKVLAQRRRELEDIEWEFKKSRFDDPRSEFREDNLAGDLLTEFLKGAISAGAYWEQWQRSQRWRPGSSDWGGGLGLPRSGRISSTIPWPQSGGGSSPWGRSGGGFGGGSSGGFSRPRTGSRGSRKSGGFKTGGGF